MSAVLRSVAHSAGLTLAAMFGAAALLGAVTVAAALGATVARAYLALWMIVSAAPIGATVLLMVATLTGGRWGEARRPILAPLAVGTVVAALSFIPVAAGLPSIYPWIADPGRVPPDVARWYLNAPSFLARAVVALGGWSLLGLLFGAGRPSRLAAGLGLAFYGLTISLVAVDWFLSVEPGYTSSDFAATVAIGQMATALAVVALVGQAGDASNRLGDAGALLIASQVGVLYLALMAFIIAWYGDLPETIGLYVRRSQGGWLLLAIAAVLIGAVGPVSILLRSEARHGGAGLPLAAAMVLAGIALHDLWLLGPAIGADAATIAGLVLIGGAGGASLLLRRRLVARSAGG